MRGRPAAALAALAVLASCAAPEPGPPRLDLEPARFADLPGWDGGAQAEALAAFRRSCAAFADAPDGRPVGPVGGSVADWRAACAAAAEVAEGDDGAARDFFAAWFAPLAASDRGEATGLFTGYYEPLLAGARTPGGRYTVPIHGRPDDLITVDLARFGVAGGRLAGRVVDGALVPYPARAEIDSGALAGRAPVLAWVDDPVDAFFLHVQGSGRIALDGGGVMRVGYAASNGRPYRSIGRALIERGAIARDEVSLQSIRAWLAAHPDEAAEVLALNPSYVFFRELSGDGPVGAQGVALTPGRSLAVDRDFVPLGAPVWLDVMAPAAEPGAPDRRLRRLVVAQDTGGAIQGPLRGDLFWGFGAEAEAVAGRMKHPGRLWLLLPRAVAAARVAAAE